MDREREIFKVTLAGGLANMLLLAFKFVAGVLAGSAAMIADAVHSLSDFATDVVVLIFVHISGKPEDKGHDYGHGKFETVATTLIGLALLAVAFGIIYIGITKIVLWAGGASIAAPGMLALWAAVASIVVKELIYRYTIRIGHMTNSQAVVANAWHHRSDALSSIGTAAGIGGAIFLGERWTVLDPIASVVVGLFIIKISFDILKNGFDELTDKSLSDEVEDEILSIVTAIPDVVEPHHLRTRRIGSQYVMEMHLRMDGDTPLREAHARCTLVERALREHFGANTHIIIHMEPTKE